MIRHILVGALQRYAATNVRRASQPIPHADVAYARVMGFYRPRHESHFRPSLEDIVPRRDMSRIVRPWPNTHDTTKEL